MKGKHLIRGMTFLVLCGAFNSFDLSDNVVFAMEVGDLDFSRRVDWTKAGYPGKIPNVNANIVNVRDIGAKGDGATDDYHAIQSAIDSAPNPAVIFFPAGTYRITSQLNLK